MATPAQFRRMAALGVGADLFPNHVYFWGDIHRTQTLGPTRAARMNGAAAAKHSGALFAFHSDAGVTPCNPLFSVWAAVNRQTASGFVLGPEERVSVEDALHAVTLGAARLLKLDGELGSIEAGKAADFAVLGDDPTAVSPGAIKDIGVWGTVCAGRVYPAA
jgi:predicted amidohydrolase YtcJ